MKVAFIGAGVSATRRSAQIGAHSVSGVYDPDVGRASALAAKLGAVCFATLDQLLASDAEIAVVATTNDALQPSAVQALKAGKHVLLEKPAAVNIAQLDELDATARSAERAVKIGFNHRFHPAIWKLRELIDCGALGELMFLRASYGHGGRLGMESEWRFSPERGGGGELLDQGVHLLDLIHWFLGPLPLAASFVTKSFWNSPVEDNAVLTLSDGKTWATFHVSCSEWKNSFSLELYGRTGKARILGLGGSYGTESLTYYRMLPEMGPPIEEQFEYGQPDDSWGKDLENLVRHVEEGAPLCGDIQSARYALEQVRCAYRANGFAHLPAGL